MAKINMILSGVLHYDDKNDGSMVPITDDISLSTEKTTATINIAVDEQSQNILPYDLLFQDIRIHKKMYQPTEIIADIKITRSSGISTDFKDISRKMVEKMFKHAKVSLSEEYSVKEKDSSGNKQNVEKTVRYSFGEDFYVHEVLPNYKSDSMLVTLKIYSLDKLLTLKESCRTFVCKKLCDDILGREISQYIKPWTIERDIPVLDKQIAEKIAAIAKLKNKILEDNWVIKKLKTHSSSRDLTDTETVKLKNLTEELEKKEEEDKKLKEEINNLQEKRDNLINNQKKMSYRSNMKILKNEDGKEHIFPFLVQYNESFYDMLARTTNRWGEFLFYEDGMLNVGYNYNAKDVIPVTKGDTQNISFCDLNAKSLILAAGGSYDYEADNSSLTGKPIQSSPATVKGQLFAFGGKEDKWIMKQFASILKNDKNLPTMTANLLFDNLFSLAQAKAAVAKQNADFDKLYFDKYDSENPQYIEETKESKKVKRFQQFTELNTEYNGKKYKSILAKEQSVGKDAICIDYSTNNPRLKLGNIISFNNEKFIVVEIIGGYNADNNLVFQVLATAQDKDGIFYPAVIPAGHVRYANPQPATITDAKDPTGKNRVRVRFSWENVVYIDDDPAKGIKDETKKVSTPWLNFASNQNGYPTMGYHYEGHQVMLGFEDGNVERPYVMGGLAADGTKADSVLTSEGMHSLTLSDGTGAGMQSFLSGAFAPMAKTLTGFAPGIIPSWKWNKDKYFEGGFELSDYYGIYKVSGSTDGRNVSIASNWGDVKINAFTGITISAPNGDVSITGKNVSIKAGNNLTLESGTNVNYKLWKSKDTTKGTAAQIMLDVTAQVAKRLAEVALNVFDLTIVRSTVEIFFRPVEGTLSVKSNRFLQLSAGNNSCSFPASAFNVEEKMKMLDEMNKKAIMQSAGIGRGMVNLFNIIPSISQHLLERCAKKYNDCVDLLKEVNATINKLKFYANDDHAEVCHTYDDLKADLWGQDKDEDWKEDKFGFSDNVAVEGTYNDIVKFNCANRVFPISGQNASENFNLYMQRDEVIVCRRRELRETITEEFNVLRKKIYELTHFGLTKQDVDKEFGHFIMRQMPKDYKKKVLTAFSKAKSIFEFSDEDKELNGLMELPDDAIKYMRRQVVMNLLEEFGFKDDMRRPIQIDGNILPSVPAKPDGDNMDEGNGNSIMNDECWENYVKSLSGVPPLGKDLTAVGGALLNAVSSGLEAEKNKLMFWKGAAEIKTWGEGKNGQILFGSGKDTYALKDNQFEIVETLKPSFTSLSDASDGLDNDDKKSLQGFVDQLRTVLLKY